MKRQIPLHLPQQLPAEWDRSLISVATIPTEEELTRKEFMDDDFYNSRVRTGLDSRALIYAVMHAFSSPVIPNITYVGGGSFNEVFSIQFPDGFRVAARILRPGRRAPGRIESTVAMMTMARCYRGIPAPEVYAWYPDDDNAVGAPYMLLEWIEGIEPWRQWHDMPSKDRTEFLNELAVHHSKFAKPLPFQGIGSIYFQQLPIDAQINFDDVSAYRLGPLIRGPASTTHRGISDWPKTNPSHLRDFWLELWQHEVDSITSRFGSDRSTVIATEDHPSSSIQETITLGQFLDVAQALLTLIRRCPLPPDSQSELYELSFAPTDYAFRNIKMDPETRKITAFIDWDDVYMMPFLLCSRYPEDICWYDGSGERWYETGGFFFLPLDEEGEIEEDLPEKEKEVVEEESTVAEDESLDSSDASEDDTVEDLDTNENSEVDGGAPDVLDEEHNYEDYDRPRRIKDTRHRRQYEQLLATHDSRFGTEGFWKLREEPMKIQHLVMHGWIEWMIKDEWLKKRAAEEEI